MKQNRTFRRVVISVLAILGVAMIPECLLAQPSDPNAAAVVAIPGADIALRPAPAERMLHRSLSGEPWVGGAPLQRAASRDSLRNGAVIGAVIGATALGTLAATLCHAYRESGGPSCVPDALRFAAIGAAIGLGAGVAIDFSRNSGPMVRLSIAF